MHGRLSDRVYSLHNHTPFSVGAFTIDEIVEAHLECQDVRIDGVGISDNLFQTPTSREPRDARDFERLFGKEAEQYVAQVNEARQRWNGKLRILCGAEVNWQLNRTMLEAIRNLLRGIDYVLFSHVDWAGLTQLASQARRFPCPIGLCDARVEEQFPNTSRDQVVRTLANARIFHEINTSFLPLAESDPWYNLLPKHRVAVALGCDTHDDLRSIRLLKPLYEYVQRRGLHDRLLEPCADAGPSPAGSGAASGDGRAGPPTQDRPRAGGPPRAPHGPAPG